MAISFNKREIQKKKQTKKQEKQLRKEERKSKKGSTSFDDMIAYVDANGNITSTPPELQEKEEIDLESIAISTPKKEELEEETVLTGRVDFYNTAKGYGFIIKTDGTEKFFFHASNAPANIAQGSKVTFEKERGTKGFDAVRIEIVK